MPAAHDAGHKRHILEDRRLDDDLLRRPDEICEEIQLPQDQKYVYPAERKV